MAGVFRPLSPQLLKQLLFFGTPRWRHHQSQGQKQITPSTFGRPTLALEPKAASRSRPRRNRHLGLAIGRHHGDGRAQGQFIKTDGQIRPELIRLKTPHRMILDAEVQVQVTAPPRPGLQVSLPLQPQARAILHTGGDAHLHTFVVDRKGAFAATKSLSKTDVDGGFGIEIDRGPGSGWGGWCLVVRLRKSKDGSRVRPRVLRAQPHAAYTSPMA